MKIQLSNKGYILDHDNNIWSRPEYGGINYNDGDDTELRIGNIIEQAADLSVLSTELRQHCTDWPSLYHLSGVRANILRPFSKLITGDVLEIGAGCGVITRYLGECGANVLALEGSPRRANIARTRTRGLENVTVLAEKFDQFQWDHQFNVITLIGVLEYANLFTSTENPPLAMLKHVRTLLKPKGKLIVAIENQLGLKYFAGAPEDHLGQPMVGIEGRYHKDQPQTFGRKVLSNMLEQAGFSVSEFLTPFPDYKLPVSILTEEGINNKKFDAATFAMQSVQRDPQLPTFSNFSLELAWPEIFKNELGLEFTNSFLVIASPNDQRLIDKRVLAYHYSTDRIPAYCKETIFTNTHGNKIRVRYQGIYHKESQSTNNPLIEFICPESDKYVYGKLLSLELIRIVTQDGWSFSQVAQFIWRYLSIVETFTESLGMEISLKRPYAKLPGVFFDVVPQNIIICEDGSPSIIDKEWQLIKPIELGHLVFRSLLLLLNSISRFSCHESKGKLTRYQFVDGVFLATGLRLNEDDYVRYNNLEAEIQQAVSGRGVENFLSWQKDQPLPMLNLSQALAERDKELARLMQTMAGRAAEIVVLNQALAERDGQIAERDGQISELRDWALGLDQQLIQMAASTSWRITLPLREMRHWLDEPKQQTKRYLKMGLRLTKRIYQSLPLSYQTKAAQRNALAKYFPKLLLLSGSHSETISTLNFPEIKPGLPEHFTNPIEFAETIQIFVSSNPLVSVIIPIYGQIDYTLRCLSSIAQNLPQVAFEVIVVDDCSPDNSADVLSHINAIRLIRNEKNMGFIRACNRGANAAQGEYLYFLNNDTEVTSHWMDELLLTFQEFPGTGLVGSKLIYPDGRLQEAGGIIWQDGNIWNFGRLQDPLLPIYNYAREVDYCSGASIMVPKKLFEELGGFDEHYLPAYCEDVDLALKIRDKGHRVIYQPQSKVIHYEGITSGTDTSQGTKAYQIENTKKLFLRWKSRLQTHQRPGIDVDSAKDRRATRRVLVIDHCTPIPNEDAGSLIIFNLLLLFREMDFQVTFIPEDNFCYMPEDTAALQRAGIEVLYAPYVTTVEQHLKEFGKRYELAFLIRGNVVDRHLKTIRKLCPQAKVLFHTVDLHFLRMSREAALQADKAKQKAADEMKQRELAAICASDASIVVSTAELELLRTELPEAKLYVFPLIMDAIGTRKTFSERKDIAFVGGYQHMPNVDAVQYFVTEIMPLLRLHLPGVCFYVVGSKPPAEIRALACEDVIVTGFVEHLNPLLDKMRVSVAPLRYGAGIKGKIGSTMAVGLPVVATPLAAEGMALTDETNILVAEGAEQFADAIVRLCQDEVLWNRISHNGLAFAQKSLGF